MEYIDYNLLYNKSSDGVEINIPVDFESSNCMVTGSDILEFDTEELNNEIFVYIQNK